MNEPRCHHKDPNRTFLETYNCDVAYPKPTWSNRAKKQIYRPSYVLSHFVHYSTVTQPMTDLNNLQSFRYRETTPSERFSNEETEAMMLHAKTMNADGTSDWPMRCKKGFVPPDRKDIHKCRMGNAFPKGVVYKEDEMPKDEYTEDEYIKNCIAHERLTDYWIPRLEKAMEKRRKEG